LKVAASLRLVRDETPPATLAAVDQSLSGSQCEIDSLRQQVALLRSRDEMVHFYLHRIDEELRLAARLQQDFLPKVMPTLGRVRFHALFRPAGYVSGDLYDVFRLDEKHVGFYLADAIGHGVPSALLSMFLRTSLVSKEIFAGGYRILPPGETLARLNTSLVSQNFSQTTFATAVYGIVDVVNSQVSLSSAGHPAPILMGRGEEATREISDCGGALLGVFADEAYPTVSFPLQPKERLLIHSDGIDSVFDEEASSYGNRWREEVAKMRSLSADAMLGEFSTRLDRQSGSLQPKDDLTIIAVEAMES
jgi:serine phosphatase RsbU (regulator of sigma subunit)